MARKKKETGFWNFVETFQGDRVILMIVLLLMVFSLLAVFSSTSLLAQETDTNRLSIVKEQFFIVGAGLILIAACYFIRNIKVFEALSKYGFVFSLVLLLWMVLKIRTPFLKAAEINGAWRILKFFGLQIHVYEVVKVAMVMYLAWAVNAFKEDNFKWINRIAAKNESFAFLGTPFWKKMVAIYLPVLITTALILKGGTSSALFIGGIMVLTIYIGGVNLKEIAALGAVAILYVMLGIFLYKATDHKVVLSDRIPTMMGRLGNDDDKDMETLLHSTPNTKEFQDAADALKQPVSALLAIKEGGVLGKGPGNSTQRYVVPVLFGDYMFSFIVEEYGLWGALIIIILFASLLARGALLAKNCDNYFAKVVLAGLVLMISLQAFMHMAINVHLVPQTGQTLPLISHGASSFLAFSIAFGIILSISRMIHVKVQKQLDKAEPIIVHTPDDVRDGLDDLDALESEEINEEI